MGLSYHEGPETEADTVQQGQRVAHAENHAKGTSPTLQPSPRTRILAAFLTLMLRCCRAPPALVAPKPAWLHLAAMSVAGPHLPARLRQASTLPDHPHQRRQQ